MNRVELFDEDAMLGVMHTKWCIGEGPKQHFTQFRSSGINTLDQMIESFRAYYLQNEQAMRTLDAALNTVKFKAGKKVDDHFTHVCTLMDNIWYQY